MKTASSEIFVILMVSFTMCSANQNCSNNICEPTETSYTFAMEAELDGTIIHLSWNFNSSVPIYGFCSKILSPDNSTLYQSPVLHSNERKMTINYELTNSEDSICLQALINQTVILAQKCEQVEVSYLKIIVGILAGTIFIIPCVLAFVFIIYKDYNVRQLEKIAQLIEEEQNDKLLCSQSIEEFHEGSDVSCDNIAELEISHGNHVTSEKANDSHAISDEGIKANNEERSEIHTTDKLPGEDNLGFVSEIPDDKITVEKSHGEGANNTNMGVSKEVKTSVIIENHGDRDIETDETDERPNEIRKKEAMTLKIDIDLARKMAEADNEITEDSVHL